MADLSRLSDESRAAVEALLRSGKKIAAIKRVRSETGLGLKEAKEAVEAHMLAHGIEAPKGSAGCLLVCTFLGLNLTLALIWLAMLVLPAGASADAGETVVRRTTLVVYDIEASIGFYRDVLGFEKWYDRTSKISESSLPTGKPVGAPSRFVIMKGRHPWIGMVGLLEYGGSEPAPGRPERLKAGDAILMVETNELAAIYARMQAAHTPILRHPKKSLVTGADGKSWTAEFLFAFDPDGHLLEINQPESTASEDDAEAP